jgi:hypothetical protein
MASIRSCAEDAKSGRPRASSIKIPQVKTACQGPARHVKPTRLGIIVSGGKPLRDNHS